MTAILGATHPTGTVVSGEGDGTLTSGGFSAAELAEIRSRLSDPEPHGPRRQTADLPRLRGDLAQAPASARRRT
ncbi:MAG: hypothetical protein V9F04_03915 [Dermatophilaceae bacterium]